jgi:CRP/FNR family transcriptional regulator, anaerobic regulatory protein
LNQIFRQDVHNSEVPLLCSSCEARHQGICGVLSPVQLVELSKHTTKSTYSADTEITAAGQPISRHSNIMRGVVKLSKLMVDGRQQIVGLQFAPDFLGRPFAKETMVTAEAATDVKVCSFSARVLDRMIEQTPELEHRLHQQALRELDEARDWLMTLGRKSAFEKLASFFYLIAVHYDPDADHQDAFFVIPLKRIDIADFLGLTPETVSRQITRLKHTGLISIQDDHRAFRVPDMERLKAVCQ